MSFAGLKTGATALAGAIFALAALAQSAAADPIYHLGPGTYGAGPIGTFMIPSVAQGLLFYLEPKYTLTPKLFAAARWEVNDYPFVTYSTGQSRWIANQTDFHDWEAGLGYRLGASTLLKASYRTDHWKVPSMFIRPGGHAFALQLSHAFDVMDWFDRDR